MEPRHYGLQVRRFIGENTEHCIPEMYEYIQDQVSAQDQEMQFLDQNPYLRTYNFLFLQKT